MHKSEYLEIEDNPSTNLGEVGIEMVIVVTGTIAPKKQAHLTIANTEDRLLQYRNTLEQLIMCTKDVNIVFCENSEYGVTAFEYLIPIAKRQGNQLELLSFLGDTLTVIEKGKGYGEGEIMQHVLANSRLLQQDSYLIKLTGRLYVDNIANIIQCINQNKIYFNIPNIHRMDMYDTRLYAMPIEIYKTFFQEAYKKVNDSQGYFLEYVYTDVVLEENLKVRNFPRYPRIIGISGSNGLIYSYSEWKSRIRDVLSMWNIYGRVKKDRNI